MAIGLGWTTGPVDTQRGTEIRGVLITRGEAWRVLPTTRSGRIIEGPLIPFANYHTPARRGRLEPSVNLGQRLKCVATYTRRL